MVNGVAHAWMDRCPLIAITDQYRAATYATGLRQRLDQLAIYAPLVKWNTTIDAKTVRHSCGGRCERRLRRRRARCSSTCRRARRRRRPADCAPRSRLLPNLASIAGPDRAGLQARLGDARRAPAGRSSWPGSACSGNALGASSSRFAEQLGAPVLTTTKCKGVIPEDHPLRAGCIIGGLIERKLVSRPT